MKPEQYLQKFEKKFDEIFKGCGVGFGSAHVGLKSFLITMVISILKEQLEEVEKEKEPKQLDNGECYFNESGDILYHLNESLKQKISKWEKLLN